MNTETTATLLAGQDDQGLGPRLNDALAEVESRFNAELLSDLACVNDLVEHVGRYRGKMLRPMLVLASGFATSPTGGELTEAHTVVSAVVEMVHMATLVHDDILDEAQTRRRGATVNHLKGNEVAVMLGDYLISHAYHLCSSLDDPSVSRRIAETTNVVCEGEMLQLANRNNWSLDESTYFEIIRRKTASLCAVCCRLGASLHDAPRPTEQHLAEFGEKIGIAFQIVDDVLDLTGHEATVGKTLGRDLEKGKLTLPLIHCLNHGSGQVRRRLTGWLEQVASEGIDGDEQLLSLMASVEATGSLEYAMQWAQRLVDQAQQRLDAVSPGSGRQMLERIAGAVVRRRA